MFSDNNINVRVNTINTLKNSTNAVVYKYNDSEIVFYRDHANYNHWHVCINIQKSERGIFAIDMIRNSFHSIFTLYGGEVITGATTYCNRGCRLMMHAIKANVEIVYLPDFVRCVYRKENFTDCI